jgi:hypothetical protein
MIQQLNEDREYDRDTHKAVESSLLAQVSELTACVLLSLSDVASLTCSPLPCI